METQEFWNRHPEVGVQKEKSAEEIVARVFSALKERVNHLRSPYESVPVSEVAMAADEDGERERRLENLNPSVAFYIIKAQIMQEIFPLLERASGNPDALQKVKWIWKQFENSGLEPLRTLKPGILNQAVAIHFLRKKGFTVHVPLAIEDVLGAVDFYAVHPDRPDMIFLFQVKPSEGTRPIVMDLSKERYQHLPSKSFERIHDYAGERSARNRHFMFKAAAFLAPDIKKEPGIDDIIGLPSAKYLDKYGNIDVL